MEYRRWDDRYIVRVDQGEEIIEQLTLVCKKENILAGTISGFGGATVTELGYVDPDDNKAVKRVVINEYRGILSLTGNITAMDFEPFCHIHVVLSDNKLNATGGHMYSCIVDEIAEISINSSDIVTRRIFDENLGLFMLDL
ncbi:MAG: DNA-binding protein [Ruminococcaceae bacterium]|nr:DNA-binding protein [Oscillospiraceae bacterium]